MGYRSWGGRRAGAGRPRSALRARTHAHPSEPHKQRPAITAHQPLRVTARFVRALLDGRSHGIRTAVTRVDIRAAVTRALELSRERDDFTIVELRVQRASLMLVVQATDKRALARGMQGFQVSAARGINRAARRRGGVFADRYRVGASRV